MCWPRCRNCCRRFEQVSFAGAWAGQGRAWHGRAGRRWARPGCSAAFRCRWPWKLHGFRCCSSLPLAAGRHAPAVGHHTEAGGCHTEMESCHTGRPCAAARRRHSRGHARPVWGTRPFRPRRCPAVRGAGRWRAAGAVARHRCASGYRTAVGLPPAENRMAHPDVRPAAASCHAGFRDAPELPAHRALRGAARGTGARAGAGADPGGERLSAICHFEGGRARFHAGDAVLDARAG